MEMAKLALEGGEVGGEQMLWLDSYVSASWLLGSIPVLLAGSWMLEARSCFS
jgi:hypothetical protein